jgi:hypothetical protein
MSFISSILFSRLYSLFTHMYLIKSLLHEEVVEFIHSAFCVNTLPAWETLSTFITISSKVNTRS